MTEEAAEKIRRSLLDLYKAPGRPPGTRGLMRSVAEAELSTGEVLRIAADAPPGVALDVEVVDVGETIDGGRMGSPCIVEAVSRRPISCGPTRRIGELLIPNGLIR